jgi:SHS2 domain-containing protein
MGRYYLQFVGANLYVRPEFAFGQTHGSALYAGYDIIYSQGGFVPRFEVIDHTADVGIIAYGRNLKQAFANSAYGMFSLIADLDGVKEKVSRKVDIQSNDQEALLVDWLNELLYLFDVEHILFKKFEIISLSRKRLQARVYGEKVDTSRHQLKTAVKAATYHMLKIEKNEGVKVRFILDI